MPASQRVILISGFTAAGKTTHARLLAKSLGWDYLGASQVRRALLPSSILEDREWTPAIDRERSASERIDHELDRIIVSRIMEARNPLVVDAWLQPWLYPAGNALRIWLQSDKISRLRKATVSFLREGMTPPADIADRIELKDRFSVEIFARLYDIAFGPDRNIFDIVIDNSRHIDTATIAASDKGIAAFEPEFEQVVKEHLRG